MPVLIKNGVTEKDVFQVIENSISETIENALIKPTEQQTALSKEASKLLVKPFTIFIQFHIENMENTSTNEYFNGIWENFDTFLGASRTALNKTKGDKLTWLIVIFAILSPLRQIQTDANELQDTDFILILNSLEINLLTMINAATPKK